jgi:altronate hydrolase
MQRRCLVLHQEDDVAVLLEDGQPEDWIETGGRRVPLRAAVPKFHKIALHRIAAGETVHKVGEAIGVASRPIEVGEHVHIQNLKSQRSGPASRA